MLSRGRRVEKKQTRVIRGLLATDTSSSTSSTPSPTRLHQQNQSVIFNEALYFDLPPPSNASDSQGRRKRAFSELSEGDSDQPGRQQLGDITAEILLLDWNRSSKEDIVGRLSVGPIGGRADGGEGDRRSVTSVGGGGSAVMLNSIGRERPLAVWYKLTE